MLLSLIGLAILTWAGLVYRLIRPVRVVPVAQANFWVPAILLTTFFHLPASFAVLRKSGTDLIERGLSSSNLLTIAVVALSAVFIIWLVIRHHRIVNLANDRILFPYYLTIAIAICSTFWAIFPAYTLYRALELAVMFTVVVLVLDRRDFAKAFIVFHAVFLGVWLAVSIPEIARSLSKGIVFSSAKHNLVPLMALSLIWFICVMPSATRNRIPLILLGVAAFIAAGSAATVATIPLFLFGWMIAATNIWMRGVGLLLTIAYFAVFIF